MCLVNSIACQYKGRGLDYDDLLLEGVKGLRKAVSKFDTKHGTKFSTYAYYWISFHIRSALASSSTISLPHHTYRLAIKVKATAERLSSLGIQPTDDAIANELNISLESFEICRRAVALVERGQIKTVEVIEKQKPTSVLHESTWEEIKYDTELDGNNDNTASLLSSSPEPNAVTNLLKTEINDALNEALARLPIAESRAIYERLGLQDIIPENFDTTTTTNNNKNKKIIPSTLSDDSKTLYLKGIRRLRRLLNDQRFPEIKTLETILLNSVEGSSVQKKSVTRRLVIVPNVNINII